MIEKFDKPEMEIEDLTDLVASEKKLLMSVLTVSLTDYFYETGNIKEEARAWFYSFEEDHLYSFRSICNYLQIDANFILDQLNKNKNIKKIKKRGKKKSAMSF